VRCKILNKIRIGVVGAGIAAISAHLPALSRSNDFELVALCDRNRERLEAVTRRWRVAHFADELNDFLRTPGIEAVIIATPPDSHAEIALSCIDHGLHVLLEKPMAPSARECEQIVSKAHEKGVHVAVNHEKRFHPTFREVQRLLRSGAVGQAFFCGVHWASNVKLAPDQFIPEGFSEGYKWRWRDHRIGGGIVHDHLPHYVDLVTHWTGAHPVAVHAQTLNVARDLLSWPPQESVWEDFGLTVARFSNDFLLRLETGTVGRSLSPLWSLGSGIGEWTEYGYIFGTQGQLRFDLLPWDSSENGRIAIWQLGRALHEKTGWAFVEQKEPTRREGSPAGAARTMFGDLLAGFAQLIRGEPSEVATAKDGLVAVAAVEACYRSASTRQESPIESEYLPVLIPDNRKAAENA
jgi:predicted dehydrogenase